MIITYIHAFLLLLGTVSCCYGMYVVFFMCLNILGMIYSGMWFVMGFLSNLIGLISMVIKFFEDDEGQATSYSVLQYQYLWAWLTVTVGYPALVTQFWLIYYPCIAAHFLIALSVIPLAAYLMKTSSLLIGSTAVMTGCAIFAHLYICHLAENMWGLIGATVMIIISMAISTPVRYNVLGMSSRELFLIALATVSYIFCLAVSDMFHHPKVVPSLKPW